MSVCERLFQAFLFFQCSKVYRWAKMEALKLEGMLAHALLDGWCFMIVCTAAALRNQPNS